MGFTKDLTNFKRPDWDNTPGDIFSMVEKITILSLYDILISFKCDHT